MSVVSIQPCVVQLFRQEVLGLVNVWALSYPISIILGYRPDVTPAVSNVFATAAMRFGHTMINPVLHRLDENFTSIPEGSHQSETD